MHYTTIFHFRYVLWHFSLEPNSALKRELKENNFYLVVTTSPIRIQYLRHVNVLSRPLAKTL